MQRGDRGCCWRHPLQREPRLHRGALVQPSPPAPLRRHQETNGVPNHQSSRLLTDVWRGLFGANSSLIASDYGDIGNLPAFGLVTNLQVGAGT